MASKPLCSVVIPTYNCLEFLPAAIGSVFDQLCDPLEILILDDGSTDGTAQWLADLANQAPQVRVFQGGGFGPAKARNLMISLAKSDLIAFLDADDLWLENKLRAQIDFHHRCPEVAMSFTDYEHFDTTGNSQGTALDFWQPEWINCHDQEFQILDKPLSKLLACNLVGTSCVVAKRKSLQNANGFAQDLPSAEDWDLWLRLAEVGKIAFSPKVTMAYLMRPDGETSRQDARVRAMVQIVERYMHGCVEYGALRAARSRIDSAKAEMANSNGQKIRATFYQMRAFFLRPSMRSLRSTVKLTTGFLTGRGK